MASRCHLPWRWAVGLSGAVQSLGLVITAGLAKIVAGSIAMGLGGYLAGRPEVDYYAAELTREHELYVARLGQATVVSGRRLAPKKSCPGGPQSEGCRGSFLRVATPQLLA
jgi:hypothetical protein